MYRDTTVYVCALVFYFRTEWIRRLDQSQR